MYHLTEHEIIFKWGKIINMKSYSLPECHKDEISKQMKELFEKGAVRDSTPLFNSLIRVVPKRGDESGKAELRFVI